MLWAVIDNPTSCETRALIRFLHARDMSVVENHHELCAIYGQNSMSDETVRQWFRMFKDGRKMLMMKSEVVGHLQCDDLVQSADQNICERRHFTISEFSYEIPQISRTILYEIIMGRLGYHKFCARWVPKILTGAHEKQRISSAVTL
jgi:hypothetical protein